MKTLTTLFVLLALATGAFALTPAQREQIAADRAELRDAMGLTPGQVSPRAIFRRELELILGEHTGKRPYGSSVLGERWRALERRESAEGLTAEVRAAWEALYFDWRDELDLQG